MAQYRNMTTATGARAEVVNAFMRGVYAWMSAGLALTALSAFYVASTPSVQEVVFGTPMLMFGLIIVQLGIVVALSAAVHKFSAGTATGLFVFYSTLNGVTLSIIFLVYTAASITTAFVVCAGMFGAMSLYGLTTKKDLTSWGSFLFMGLIGIIIASVVNIFLRNPMMHFVISGVGVLVFRGAYRLRHPEAQDHGRIRPHGRQPGPAPGNDPRGADPLPRLRQPLPHAAALLRAVEGLEERQEASG
jgi:uncharacterized protein